MSHSTDADGAAFCIAMRPTGKARTFEIAIHDTRTGQTMVRVHRSETLMLIFAILTKVVIG